MEFIAISKLRVLSIACLISISYAKLGDVSSVTQIAIRYAKLRAIRNAKLIANAPKCLELLLEPYYALTIIALINPIEYFLIVSSS